MSTVRVIYHFEDGGWWADSPDVERWSAAAPDLEELIRLVLEGVPFALEAENVEIRHWPAPDLLDVFAGRTAGAQTRVRLSESFRGMLDAPRAGVGEEMLVS